MISKSDKKAAMQLGVSTIVILVIAMVVIGSGISFIRTFFQEGQDALLTSIPSSDLTINPTRDDPFAISTSELTAQQGTSKTIELAIYNKENQALNFSVSTDCKNRTGSTYSNFSVVSTSKTIEPQSVGGYQAIFTIPEQASSQSPFVCNLMANGTTSASGGASMIANKDLVIRATG